MRYPFGTLTVSKLKSEHTYALVTSRGSHWDKNAPQLQCPRAATRTGSAWVSKAITHRRKNHKSRLKTPTLVAGIAIPKPAEFQFAARAQKIGEKPYHTCRNRWPDDGERSRRSFGRNRAFLFDFPAKSRRLAAGPGWGRKRTAARSFWYRPRQLWWSDESTAGQNVADCFRRRELEERERDAWERERIVFLSLQLRFEPTTCLRTHLAVLYATVHPKFPNSFQGMIIITLKYYKASDVAAWKDKIGIIEGLSRGSTDVKTSYLTADM
ncbi:unnamed protein product [Prunus armeniaca]